MIKFQVALTYVASVSAYDEILSMLKLNRTLNYKDSKFKTMQS